MRIRFTKTVRLETEGRHLGPLFEADSEHTVSPETAERWFRRGVAVEVSERPKAEARPMAKPKDDPEPKADEQPKVEEKPKSRRSFGKRK